MLRTIEATIDKGLTCVGTDYKTPEAQTIVFEIPPQDELQVSQVLTSFENGKGIVNIFTTQPLIGDDLKLLVNVTPLVEFKVELLPNGMMLTGDFVEGETYQLEISKPSKVKSWAT